MLRKIGVVVALAAVIGAALPACVAAQDLAIDIKISPNVLYLSSGGAWVTIHADVPYADVVTCGVAIGGVSVPIAVSKADLQGNLVLKLRRADVDPVVEPGWATVVVSGTLSDGTAFVGAKDYRVRDEPARTRQRRNG